MNKRIFPVLLTMIVIAAFALAGSTFAAAVIGDEQNISAMSNSPISNPISLPAAQFGGNQCSALVTEALERVGEACDSLGRNEACYGNQRVDARFRSVEQIVPFISSGDIAPLEAFQRITTTPFSDLMGIWGIAVIKAQANLPDSLPGQNVTMVLYGEAEVDNPTADMRAVTVRTRIGGLACEELPESGVLIQSPRGERIEMTLNGVDVSLGSTMHVTASQNDDMILSLLEGSATITSMGETRILIPGAEVWVGMGGEDGLTANTEPSELRPFDSEEMARLPLGLLDEAVIVPDPIPGDRSQEPFARATPTISGAGGTCTPRADWFAYRVQPGDTFSGISARANISIPDLVAANCLADTSRLVVGWILRVPRQISGPPASGGSATSVPVDPGTTVPGRTPIGNTYITLTANPATVSLNYPCTVLSWAITADNPNYTATLNGMGIGATGSMTQCPTATTTYTLTLAYASGETRSASIIVTYETYVDDIR